MAALTNQSDFFSHLKAARTQHILLAAETDDFDEATSNDWMDEGFQVTYVPLGEGGPEFTRRLHAVADEVVGISDRYAIVGRSLQFLRTAFGLVLIFVCTVNLLPSLRLFY